MPLGTEVNLGPGDVALDGVATPPKRGTAPVFGQCLLWRNGWMDSSRQRVPTAAPFFLIIAASQKGIWTYMHSLVLPKSTRTHQDMR